MPSCCYQSLQSSNSLVCSLCSQQPPIHLVLIIFETFACLGWRGDLHKPYSCLCSLKHLLDCFADSKITHTDLSQHQRLAPIKKCDRGRWGKSESSVGAIFCHVAAIQQHSPECSTVQWLLLSCNCLHQSTGLRQLYLRLWLQIRSEAGMMYCKHRCKARHVRAERGNNISRALGFQGLVS